MDGRYSFEKRDVICKEREDGRHVPPYMASWKIGKGKLGKQFVRPSLDGVR